VADMHRAQLSMGSLKKYACASRVAQTQGTQATSAWRSAAPEGQHQVKRALLMQPVALQRPLRVVELPARIDQVLLVERRAMHLPQLVHHLLDAT
jgi:hypothetical protein